MDMAESDLNIKQSALLFRFCP